MAIDQQELAGATSRIWRIWIADSSSTSGAGLASLVAASLSAYYHSPSTTAAVQITLATMSTMNAYTSGGFAQIDATNMPGAYAFCPPNAVLATGPNAIVILKGGASMAPKVINCQIVAFDPYTAPATAPTNWSSLSIDGNGRVDVIKIAGTTQTARDIGTSVLLSSGTGTGQISLSSGTVTVGTNNDKTGYTASTVSDKTGYSLTQSFPSNFASMGIAATGEVDADIQKINGTTVNGNGAGTPWGP